LHIRRWPESKSRVTWRKPNIEWILIGVLVLLALLAYSLLGKYFRKGRKSAPKGCSFAQPSNCDKD